MECFLPRPKECPLCFACQLFLHLSSLLPLFVAEDWNDRSMPALCAVLSTSFYFLYSLSCDLLPFLTWDIQSNKNSLANHLGYIISRPNHPI
jgi:hypothetical protein